MSQPALQAMTILVAMANEKYIWGIKFWGKSPIGDQQVRKKNLQDKFINVWLNYQMYKHWIS